VGLGAVAELVGQRLPGSVARLRARRDELLERTLAVATSVGSACHGSEWAVSGVLGAMGIAPERALGAVRLSIGEPTTDEEI
jgi:cysteine desulfurase